MGKVSRWTRLKWAIWRRPKLEVLLKIIASCLWYVWHYSGARWVWEHLNPRTESEIEKQKAKDRRAATAFPLWLIGSYIALFGIASGRYESHVDRYEIRTNALVALLANDKIRPIACSQIAKIQETMVPLKPEVFEPDKTFKSFWKNTLYKDGIQVLVEAVESCKANLQHAKLQHAKLKNANLANAYLEDANLYNANLSGANLQNANLEDANPYFANLHNANLHNANLQDADLFGANLHNANLHNANLQDADLFIANLSDANLSDANLQDANLEGANLCFIENWQHENWGGTYISSVKNAPDGFKEWALAYGAVEENFGWWSKRIR